MNTLQIIKIGSHLLREKDISSHIIDSELLLSKALNKRREEILLNLNKKLTKKSISIFK